MMLGICPFFHEDKTTKHPIADNGQTQHFLQIGEITDKPLDWTFYTPYATFFKVVYKKGGESLGLHDF